MDLRGARNRLMHTLDWRKQNNMTGSLLEDWTDISEECPMTFDGYDKESRPGIYMHFTIINLCVV